MTATSAWDTESVNVALNSADDPLTVLVALQAVHEHIGHVPEEAISLIAARCNASRADVYGVLTFYSDLRREPAPETVVRICLGEACQAVGGREMYAAAGLLDSQSLEVGHVYCLGNCALGPTAEINGRVVGRLTEARLIALVEDSDR